jgi:hypothetical protein
VFGGFWGNVWGNLLRDYLLLLRVQNAVDGLVRLPVQPGLQVCKPVIDDLVLDAGAERAS